VVNAKPRPLYSQERPGTHYIGGWVDPRVGLDGCGKSPRTIQPVASRYTDYAMPAHNFNPYPANVENRVSS